MKRTAPQLRDGRRVFVGIDRGSSVTCACMVVADKQGAHWVLDFKRVRRRALGRTTSLVCAAQ